MLRRDDRDRVFCNVDAETQQLLVDVGEVAADEILVAVRDVEVYVIEAEPLDLVVDRAGDDVARRELGALVEPLHEALPAAFDSGRELQLPALAAHRLGDQEVLDLEVVEAGRVELHELHIRNPAARAPCHCDAVASRSARRGRVEVSAARAAAGEDRRPAGQGLHPLGLAVPGIEAVDRAAGRKMLRVAAGDEVDRDHVRHERDVGVLGGRAFERLADRITGRVGDMDDAPVTVPAFAGQMQRAILAGERHAETDQMLDRPGRGLDDMLDHADVVQPRAGDHRVVDVGFEAVALLEHGSDPALRARRSAVSQRAFGDHCDLVRLGEVERRS
jgi:hypothetical protein